MKILPMIDIFLSLSLLKIHGSVLVSVCNIYFLPVGNTQILLSGYYSVTLRRFKIDKTGVGDGWYPRMLETVHNGINSHPILSIVIPFLQRLLRKIVAHSASNSRFPKRSAPNIVSFLKFQTYYNLDNFVSKREKPDSLKLKFAV